jgi:hypothetical protein
MLCFVSEIEAFKPLTPVVVTYHSTTAGEFNALSKQFRAEVINTADRLAAKIAKERSQEAPQKFLPHAFWLPVGAKGQRAKVGKKGEDSKYAPMVGYWDGVAVTSENPDEVMAALQALATPADIRQYVATSFYEEAKIWLDGERQKLARKISGDVAEPADTDGEVPFPAEES